MSQARAVTLIEYLIIIIFSVLITGLIYMLVIDDNSAFSIRVDNEVPQTSLSFPAILGDDKGRTVPAVVIISPEDVPKLAQGGPWRVLIDTDDPRWNLKK